TTTAKGMRAWSRAFFHEKTLPGAPTSDIRSAVSRLLGVRCPAGKVEGDAGLVAQDPRVVTRRAIEEVTGTDLDLAAVIHLDGHSSRNDIAGVMDHAALRADDGLHALGPLPARLEYRLAENKIADLDDVHFPLGKAARLVGLAQVL